MAHLSMIERTVTCKPGDWGQRRSRSSQGRRDPPFVIDLAADTAKLLQATCRHKLARIMITFYAFDWKRFFLLALSK